MKVYISGKITGLNFEETSAKFQEASELIEAMGMTPVNPLIGADQTKTWEQHMVRDIELLMGCDAIILLDDWNESRGARIEKFIAEQRNMLIFYQRNFQKEKEIVKMVSEAVTQATRIPKISLSGTGKKRMQYFARMIFTKIMLENDTISVDEVSRIIGRNKLTVVRYLRNYDNEHRVNQKFRRIVKEANQILLNINVSQ